MKHIIPFSILLATPTHSGEMNLSNTIITLRDSDPPAIAEVHMLNRSANDPRDNVTFTLSHDGMNVEMRFHYGIGSLPEGVTCIPVDCILIVDENDQGVMKLYSVEGVGM